MLPEINKVIPNKKLKIGSLTPISGEWLYLHSDHLDMVENVEDADYIIYESNDDPIHIIEKIKAICPKEKLVFILSGDKSGHIDNECIWFTNAVKTDGLSSRQAQIFVTNPAIFKFYETLKTHHDFNSERPIDIYFKGTIWKGMRTDMYNALANKPKCEIIGNNQYWDWRVNSPKKSTQQQIENTAFESYNGIVKAKLCLCPKGKGNSSMRIVEALACGAIPILIDDFSAPFNVKWGEEKCNSENIALVFDTQKHSWDVIYSECMKLINNVAIYEAMQAQGQKYFENTIYGDAQLPGFKMYNNIDTVCFGFSGVIIKVLMNI